MGGRAFLSSLARSSGKLSHSLYFGTVIVTLHIIRAVPRLTVSTSESATSLEVDVLPAMLD